MKKQHRMKSISPQERKCGKTEPTTGRECQRDGVVDNFLFTGYPLCGGVANAEESPPEER